MHFAVPGIVSALARGGVDHNFTAGFAGGAVERDDAALHTKRSMNGMQAGLERPMHCAVRGVDGQDSVAGGLFLGHSPRSNFRRGGVPPGSAAPEQQKGCNDGFEQDVGHGLR